MKWVTWIEPYGPNDEPIHMMLPTSTAIAVMKEKAERNGGCYLNDQHALDDFMVIH